MVAALASRVNAPTCLGTEESAGRAAKEPRALVPLGRRRHSEVGTILVALPAGSRSRDLGAEGRLPRRGAPQCGAGVVDVRFAAFALRLHEAIASREACDVRSALESASVEAGDG